MFELFRTDIGTWIERREMRWTIAGCGVCHPPFHVGIPTDVYGGLNEDCCSGFFGGRRLKCL